MELICAKGGAAGKHVSLHCWENVYFRIGHLDHGSEIVQINGLPVLISIKIAKVGCAKGADNKHAEKGKDGKYTKILIILL